MRSRLFGRSSCLDPGTTGRWSPAPVYDPGVDSYAYAPPPPPLPPQPAVRRWWQHPGLVVGALVVLPPVGIGLAWLSLWDRKRKVLASVLAAVWFVLPFLGGDPAKEEKAGRDDARPPKATATVSAAPKPAGPPVLVGKGLTEAKEVASGAGYSVVSHDASEQDARQWDADEWTVCFQASAGQRDGGRPVLDLGVVRVGVPCPVADGEKIPWPTMPAVTGMTFARAGEVLKPVGFRKVAAESAYSDVALPGVADPWKVCFQDPAPGKEIENPQYSTVYLKVAPPGAACPERPYAELHPSPAPENTGGGSAYYADCDEAEAAGVAPLRSGEPGYRSALDRDHDGIACDT
ncbi:excalibur calcium-binding domain-containing protein [Streptomyces sp. NPDC015661]|uniref:excalibur calcium-binding domain-containing protein n=1 Tax=Streptomyces sp. NPDC015661 TaxID=3364961 RepID=UPI0036FD8FE5